MAFPLLLSPLGWLALGAGGYVCYKLGRKKGEDERAAAEITAVPETDADAEKTAKAPVNEKSNEK
ncbi:hypothetical protein [Desulfocicer niacini]